MSAERLKRVESFAELETGMIVVYRGCVYDGANHRAMLMSLVNLCSCHWLGGPCKSWSTAPPTSHGDMMLDAGTVASGNLFRVVDDPRADASGATTKTLETVR